MHAWNEQILKLELKLAARCAVSGCWPSCCCGQTAGYIKLLLGMEVGFSPSDFVLNGDSVHPKKGGASILGQCPLWTNGWIY